MSLSAFLCLSVHPSPLIRHLFASHQHSTSCSLCIVTAVSAWATATLKHLLPIEQKCYGEDWLSGPWANHITTKPPFLTLYCLCLLSHRWALSTSVAAPWGSFQHAAPHIKGSTVSGGGNKQERKSGPCSKQSTQWMAWLQKSYFLQLSSLLSWNSSCFWCTAMQFLMRFLVFWGILCIENLTLSIWLFGISRQSGTCGRVQHNDHRIIELNHRISPFGSDL